MGDRMIGLKRISQDLANFFKNIKADIKAFRFLFTKYLDRKDPDVAIEDDDIDKVKETLAADLLNAYEALNDDDKADKNLMIFYGEIKEIVSDPDDIMLVDPFDTDKRIEILD